MRRRVDVSGGPAASRGLSFDDWLAYEWRAVHYDPSRLQRDLAELYELRQRVIDLSQPRPEEWRHEAAPSEGNLPPFVVQRLGWGLIWRVGALAAVQVLSVPRVPGALVLALLALVVVIGAGSLLRRRSLAGTLWRIAAPALVTQLAVHLATPYYLLALGIGILVVAGDAVWTVLWPDLRP
jgi:hypothetical protein